MLLGSDHVRVTVPATSANLGPGFDVLGVALELRDEVEVRALGASATRVDVVGEGAGSVPTDETHLVVRAIHAGLEYAGAPLVGMELTCINRIPHGRGLGSSAAAVVAGLMAARGLIGNPHVLDDATVLRLATSFEGHPDNAAPAVLGGFTAAWFDAPASPVDPGGAGLPAVHARSLPVDERIAATVIIPTSHLSTARARGVLPAEIPMADATFNVARVALLVRAVGSDPADLWVATQDRIHQERRRGVMPQTAALISALRERGLAAVVSGAGPTVLVLSDRAAQPAVEQTAAEVVEAVAARPGEWRVMPLPLAGQGATVERI